MPDAPGVMAGWRGAPARTERRRGPGREPVSIVAPQAGHRDCTRARFHRRNSCRIMPRADQPAQTVSGHRARPRASRIREPPAACRRRRKESHATWCQRISVSARHRRCPPARLRIFRAGVIGSSDCGDCKSRRSSSCRWPIMRPPPRRVPAAGWSRAALAPASSWPAPQVPITRSPRSRQHWAGSMPPATGSAGNAACPCRPHGWKPARSAAIAPAAARGGAALPPGQGRLDGRATGRRGIIRLGRLAANRTGWRRRMEARSDDGDGAAGGRRA
jgi:hypothetical protein